MTLDASLILNDFACRLRPLLGKGVELSLHVAPDCPDLCGVETEQLELALAEMVRRVTTVMPTAGLLELSAGASAQPPRNTLAGSKADADAWLAIIVGSRQAHLPGLEWPAHCSRLDLAQLARRNRGALSTLALWPRGVQLALHLPGTRQANPQVMPGVQAVGAPAVSNG